MKAGRGGEIGTPSVGQLTPMLRVGPARGFIVNSGRTLVTACGCKPTLRMLRNPRCGGTALAFYAAMVCAVSGGR